MDAFTKEMIEDGRVYVDVYPMLNTDDGSRLIEGKHEVPDFYDVALNPNYNARPDGDISPYEEWENLTLEQASEKVLELETKYPGISVDWIYE